MKIDPLHLALRYGFEGETINGYHLANGMFAPWEAIKRMAIDRAQLADENVDLRKRLGAASGAIQEPKT